MHFLLHQLFAKSEDPCLFLSLSTALRTAVRDVPASQLQKARVARASLFDNCSMRIKQQVVTGEVNIRDAAVRDGFGSQPRLALSEWLDA